MKVVFTLPPEAVRPCSAAAVNRSMVAAKSAVRVVMRKVQVVLSGSPPRDWARPVRGGSIETISLAVTPVPCSAKSTSPKGTSALVRATISKRA